MAYVIDKTCTKCGACLGECPTGSIVEGSKQYFIDTDTCADHALCVVVCPVDAIAPLKLAETKSTAKPGGKP
ncbi:MAG: indolepyruvate ferredoxin oxidoreductase subunit alpha [Bacteriovoracia bacterium]